jgi:type IV pilus assembly protein PilA
MPSRRSDDEHGFTLIELLVVIIIIGVLAGIAIPVLLSQRGHGYAAAVESDLHNAATAQDSYLAGHGAYSTQSPTGSDLEAEGFKYSPSSNYADHVAAITTTVGSDGGAFCLTATSASGQVFVWDSEKGGMLPDGEACSF